MKRPLKDFFTVSNLINAGFLIAGVLILIGPAIQNGFPILHSDSGTYLLEGFGNKIPVSRPLSYCLFVRFSSYIFTIWSVIILQALMTYWMIWLTVNTLTGKKDIAWMPFITVAILGSSTGLAFYASQIMPDIFLPIAMMGIFVLLIREKLPLKTMVLIGVIVWISLIVHMSNIPIITAVSIGLLALIIFNHRTGKVIFQAKFIALLIILLVSWITNPLISLGYGEGFRTSNSSSIVFFSRLLQAGAAQEYIKDKCEEDSSYYLCEYRDVIDGYNRLDVFLWNDTSFLYDHPCREKTWDACWRDRNEEFGIVNSAILAHPPSRKIYMNEVWNDFLLQLRSFELTAYVTFKAGSHIDYPIKRYYKNDRNAFLNSRQAQATLNFREQNSVIRWTIIVSLIILIGMIIRTGKYFSLKSPFTVFMLMILATWLINGALVAALAVVSNRFLGRFIWLVPLLVILMIYREYTDRQQKI
ncbi:MAG: hypothetical protein MUC31_00230 [Bacteroidales bacterium]|nr:hypothetical protein [Bacteroidales bacterium]